MTEIELLRKQIVALQERITKIDKKQTCVVHFVTNETIPQSLDINTIYYNKDNTSIGLYDDLSREWLWTNLSTLGLIFTDISAFFIDGTNTTVVVDPTNETIQINASGGTQIQADWNQADNTEVDYIKNKPTEFPPSAHDHPDTQVNLSETYTGNLAGATTQKDVNDILDIKIPKLNIDYIIKGFATTIQGMALKCATSTETGRLITCETSFVRIYDIDLQGNVIRDSVTSIATTTTGLACYVPELDQFWVIQMLGDTIYKIDATNKTLTTTLTGLAVATGLNRYCFEYFNGYVYFQRDAYCQYINRIDVTDNSVTTGVGMFWSYGFEHNGTKFLAVGAQLADNGVIIEYESDLSNFYSETFSGFGSYKKSLYYDGKLYIYNDRNIANTTGTNFYTKVFDMASSTFEANLNNAMISPCLVYGKYVVGRLAVGESTIVLKDLSNQKNIDTLIHQIIPSLSVQAFAFCTQTNTLYCSIQNATAGNNAILVIKIF